MKKSFLIFALIVFASSAHADKPDGNYQFDRLPRENLLPEVPALPDLSPYSVERIAAMVPPKDEGTVSIRSMKGQTAFWKFTDGDAWKIIKKKQDTDDPKAVIVQSGVHDLDDLVEEINDPAILSREENFYLLQLPLYIGPQATVIFRGTGEQRQKLALSSQDGAFILNAGKAFAIDADIFSWDLATRAYQAYANPDEFRAFWLSVADSRTYFANSIFRSLGYNQAKSYGISFSSDAQVGAVRPSGWIINCSILEVYYGFYSYEADDVVLLNNKFERNIYYAIDPHDRSERLIIANNETSGTKIKHGIIISRNVNNSFIIGNKSYGNAGSGIMLDRTSEHNVVYNNIIYNNQGYGIAFFESPNNRAMLNVVYGNAKDGIRVRNSWNIGLSDNTVLKNGGYGLVLKSSDISNQPTRDFKKDPYVRKADARLEGGILAENQRGAITVSDADKLQLIAVSIPVVLEKVLRGEVPLSDVRLLVELMRNGEGAQFLWKRHFILARSAEDSGDEAE